MTTNIQKVSEIGRAAPGAASRRTSTKTSQRKKYLHHTGLLHNTPPTWSAMRSMSCGPRRARCCVSYIVFTCSLVGFNALMILWLTTYWLANGHILINEDVLTGMLIWACGTGIFGFLLILVRQSVR